MLIKNHKKIPTLITKSAPLLVPFYLKDGDGNLDLKSWDGKTGFMKDEWRCYYKDKDIAISVVIYEHFKTNLGSVPSPFDLAIEDGGELAIAYLIHDFLYSTWLLPRWKVDDILYTTRNLCGGYWIANVAVHAAVVTCGQSCWDACGIVDGKIQPAMLEANRKFGKVTIYSCSDKLLEEIANIDVGFGLNPEPA